LLGLVGNNPPPPPHTYTDTLAFKCFAGCIHYQRYQRAVAPARCKNRDKWGLVGYI
jgi:hypothetical protein